jgi:phosphate transport system protein
MLKEQIESLKARLIRYARLVADMIERSVKAFSARQPKVLEEIINKDEPRANELELELEEECVSLIAQFEPKARELRTVLMVLGITNDLERLADHAVNIAEAAGNILTRTPLRIESEIPRMAGLAIRMMEDSIKAFIEEDAALARQVCRSDNAVDELADLVRGRLVETMAETRDPTIIDPSLSVLKIAANLERIADLSTNIGEDVIFMVEGRVIKHHKQEQESEA